jgi:hypothetical protein
MKTIDKDTLYFALQRNHWHPSQVIDDHSFSGIQLRVEPIDPPSLGEMEKMKLQELQEYWNQYALVRIGNNGDVSLCQAIVAKDPKITYKPKLTYRIEDYKNEATLAMRIIEDLHDFFKIKDEF